jgi:hypothetical protein
MSKDLERSLKDRIKAIVNAQNRSFALESEFKDSVPEEFSQVVDKIDELLRAL